MATTVESRPTRAVRRVPLPVTVSAWAVPVMVVGQFALVAGVPVVIAVAGALRRVPDRAVRRAATPVAVAFAIPLAVWLTRPSAGSAARVPSLVCGCVVAGRAVPRAPSGHTRTAPDFAIAA
ncbi:hypothetical protein OG453_40885 [Streptomyces sp. NBC_01381]|uniref:hypothetical protein n=1 Tax=Streptomyces sp. NBC_01381 TaxID=2903845 RepID=UPI00224E6952|nr:hypothetical protein [Streptomyces sp. NBC_01381]MCX4672927.1 hypothetical protein [Streptomyces sp. NBC_01381]